MTRHSKNATAGATYTYHEKNKDSSQSGYGSKNIRLSKDAIKEFDCCSLTLQPCHNPVITPDGWIYEKEVILEYILHKKLENARLLKEFQKQREKNDQESKELSEASQKERLEKFLKAEGKLVSSSSSSPSLKISSTPQSSSSSSVFSTASTSSTTASTSKSTASEERASVSNMQGELGKKLPSFWIPSLVPESKIKTQMKKPETTIYCPMSNKPISLRDLVEVKFKLLDDKEDKRSLIAKTDRYVCPVTNDILNNSVPCVVLRTSGAVVTQEAVDKILKKDMIDVVSGKKMTEKDIIPIQRGGTGYAGSGVKLNSKIFGPAMIS